MVTRSKFPPAFVWTKMQAEAGQPLEDIVRRKEFERAAGDGVFFWGIGNALGENLRRLVGRELRPAVLFSIMRSRPKRHDVDPSSLFLWTGYTDESGRTSPIPPHALVLSRGETGGGQKRRHYALICRSDAPLRLAHYGSLDAAHFRNLGSSTPRIGASQVTAVVEHETWESHQLDAAISGPAGRFAGAPPLGGPTYEVNMRAELTPPYFVRLARPLLVPDHARRAIGEARNCQMADGEWVTFVATIRLAAEANTRCATGPEDLFGCETA